jgi:hypothetical protein
MECRVRHDIKGSWLWCPQTRTGYENGALAGEIVDLGPEHIVDAYARGQVDLRPKDAPPTRGLPDADEIAALRARVGKIK